MTEAMYDVITNKYPYLRLVMNWLPWQQHIISFSIKYKTIFLVMSKVTHYPVGFGEKTAKYLQSKFQYF